jgi:hypothetical protein
MVGTLDATVVFDVSLGKAGIGLFDRSIQRIPLDRTFVSLHRPRLGMFQETIVFEARPRVIRTFRRPICTDPSICSSSCNMSQTKPSGAYQE